MKNALLLIALLAAGCRSLPEPLPGKNWKTLTGQVRYQDSQRTLVADVVLRSAPDKAEYSVEITKAGAPLLKLDRLDADGWSKGFLGRRSYHGPLQDAPAHLKSWFAATNQVLRKTPVPASGADPEIKIDFRLQP